MMPPENRSPVKTVLIANRGEIAVRVARTCKEMGLRVVAVHSTADRDSAVTRLADQVVHIGPAPAKRSYLNVPAIIEAAQQTGADAIHPGYGFLSEDADFAEICVANGITFVGPPPAVMRKLADKAQARAFMQHAGLPVLPGEGPVASAIEAREVADRIGYPLIIKAVAGGGGRRHAPGQRPGRPAPCLQGDSRRGAGVLRRQQRVHRAVPPGRAACRDPGAERRLRRHRAPGGAGLLDSAKAAETDRGDAGPGLPAGLAARMGEAAVRGAQQVGYEGAGTFEFLVDEDGRFYFMEINCRIQVEHPVTEMVTGIDLIREQIRVAAGEPLGIGQADVVPRGVAIEARINAEDPRSGFAPTAGLVAEFIRPTVRSHESTPMFTRAGA